MDLFTIPGPADVAANPLRPDQPERLHKGGRHKANALAAKAARDAANDARKNRKLAQRVASKEAKIATKQIANQRRLASQNAELIKTLSEKAPLTQIIDDRKKKKRGAFGLTSTRSAGRSQYGLGGFLGQLGNGTGGV